MQKVHSSQEYNLCCPACGVEVSCFALEAHMMNHRCKSPPYSTLLCYCTPSVPMRKPPNPTFVSHSANTNSNSHPEALKTAPKNQGSERNQCPGNKVPEKRHPCTIWVKNTSQVTETSAKEEGLQDCGGQEGLRKDILDSVSLQAG